MPKLDTKHFTLTITLFAGVAYAVCAALSFAAPSALLWFANQAAHTVDFSGIAKAPTPEGAVAGFVAVVAVAAISSAFFSWLWNRLYRQLEVKE